MRLDKLLENNKVGSKKQVKRLLLTGQVTVDGQVVRSGEQNVDPGLNDIMLNQKRLPGPAHRYYMLNKPQGVVTAVSDEDNITVMTLLKESGIDTTGLFPVGRLDKDTEGLVFITDNGQLAYELAMASRKVVKRYYVEVNGLLRDIDKELFQQGIVFLDGTICRAAVLTILTKTNDKSTALLDISEGKFHQVKKMFLSVGHKVMFLKRLSIGSLCLDDSLELGMCRHLSDNELEALGLFFIKDKKTYDN